MNVIEVAKKYLGMAEKPGNVFDETTPLGILIKKAGHRNGESWCCYFQEGIFCEANPEKEVVLRNLFSANCLDTYYNFIKAGYRVVNYPVAGALVIFQDTITIGAIVGIQTTKGHAALCTSVISKTQFTTIEGNTSEAGSREGTIVGARSNRDTLRRDKGLQVLGFIII
jgi:hypothetical protein